MASQVEAPTRGWISGRLYWFMVELSPRERLEKRELWKVKELLREAEKRINEAVKKLPEEKKREVPFLNPADFIDLEKAGLEKMDAEKLHKKLGVDPEKVRKYLDDFCCWDWWEEDCFYHGGISVYYSPLTNMYYSVSGMCSAECDRFHFYPYAMEEEDLREDIELHFHSRGRSTKKKGGVIK